MPALPSASYTCPTDAPSSAVRERPSTNQYNVLSGGNENLKLETSKQFRAGMCREPSPFLQMGVSLSDVTIRDVVPGIS